MNKRQLIRFLNNQKFPERIIKAFEKIRREDFISKEYKKIAYENIPLSIGHKQTISQPYTIAFMLFLLELDNFQRILEIGSGSGYVLALINEISKNSEIYGIERIKEIAKNSKKVLKNENISIIIKDGSKGLKEKSPFDRILVSATSKEIPQKLIVQLKEGGILVAPVRNSIIQIKKFRNENKIKEFPGFVFVPLIDK
jgi:protein-L-isoaspartate(D-aspartate) O-methyltransferase